MRTYSLISPFILYKIKKVKSKQNQNQANQYNQRNPAPRQFTSAEGALRSTRSHAHAP